MTSDSRLPRVDVQGVPYQILVALGEGRKHGYAIMREVEERTGGRVQLLPGTLYSTIKKMLRDGLLEACPAPAESSDERRRYYQVTRRGREVAVEETERLEALLRLARKKGFASAR